MNKIEKKLLNKVFNDYIYITIVIKIRNQMNLKVM